jgi:Family of unknown function (DUF6527)
MRVTSYNVLGVTDRYGDAAQLLNRPGDCVIVERSGVQRQLVLTCPDGCGDVLSINLDPRAGRAWRLYERRGAWSLFPSIEKPNGCRSHFILSRGRIVWCDWWNWPDDREVVRHLQPIKAYLRSHADASYVEIAERLDDLPWDTLQACRVLVDRGEASEGVGDRRGHFRLM